MTTPAVSEAWERIDRAGAAVAAAFERTDSADRRVTQLAEVLRGLCPAAEYTACAVREGGPAVASVRDRSGLERPELSVQFLSAWDGNESLREIPLSGQRLLVEPIVVNGRTQGALAVGADLAGRVALSVVVRQVALHLALEERQGELASLREDLAEENTLAGVGELAGPVVHEFNNLLNTMLLQVAVMEQKVDESLQADLRTIRKQASGVIALVKQWQQCRRRPLPPEQPYLDVNALVEEAVTALRRQRGGTGTTVTLSLAPKLLSVRGAAADLRRLTTFLVLNALAVSEQVTVRTEASANAVVLLVEDGGPGFPPEKLPRMFEPLAEGRAGTNRLELAACRTLVRRFQGKIVGENRATGGVTVVVELPGEPL
jgi:signal transduction histidine kinase